MQIRLHNGPSENTPTLHQGGKVLLTVPEAAARLGIGRTLMYELIRTGAIASVQVGRLRRIRPADLETYVAGLVAAPAGQQIPAAA